ncbi:unnamed protein product, partial [Soboliphyme baturini]|uniref:HECT-type E3 ubiquitin transferase n=1 Tax=Soboliphyme baturini TaxID=241478 RepID=A0A183J071_9BILA
MTRQQQLQRQQPPDAPVDLTAFFETLPPSLRQQILSDVDDSQIALLPAHIANEARRLRSQYDEQEAARFASMSRQFSFMNFVGRREGRYSLRAPPRQNAFDRPTLRRLALPSCQQMTHNYHGLPLLDKEALSCLLVMFFMDDQQLNIARLHRLMKCLCYHATTRDWLMRAMISIMEKTADSGPGPTQMLTATESGCESARKEKVVSIKGKPDIVCTLRPRPQNWLSITISGALGAPVDVFQIQRHMVSGKRIVVPHASNLSINPLAVDAVCRNVLDSLISLAKTFPTYFLPDCLRKSDQEVGASTVTDNDTSLATSSTTLTVVSPSPKNGQQPQSTPASSKTPTTSESENRTSDWHKRLRTDFWDILLRLDSVSAVATAKRSKSATKQHFASHLEAMHYVTIEESPFGHLMLLLEHPFIKKSPTLIDKTLRLIALTANAIPLNAADKLARQDVSCTTTDEVVYLEQHLKLLVTVITNCLCGDEGYDDGRSIFIRLVRCFGTTTRRKICEYLLEAAQMLGCKLRDEIKMLLAELTAVFPSRELQLVTVSNLTVKDSVQHCLLRTINVVMMLRESINAPSSSLPVADASALESEAALPDITSTHSATGTVETTAAAEGGDAVQPSASDTQQPAESTSCNLAPDTEPPVVQKESSEDKANDEEISAESTPLSRLLNLEDLWEMLSECLNLLAEASDPHAVLIFQPAVEAFFLVHAGERKKKDVLPPAEAPVAPTESAIDSTHVSDGSVVVPSPTTETAAGPASSVVEATGTDAMKFLRFAGSVVRVVLMIHNRHCHLGHFVEKHRTVLNQILRQSTQHLADGPFAVLVSYTRILDFDIKRKYFRKELERIDQGFRREDVVVRIRRDHVFQDSFRELFRLRSHEWISRFYIIFEGEEGQDAGGLLREWFSVITREIFNPNYALFMTSPGDRVTYMINPSSYVNREHLDYFKFIGRLIAKAVYDNKLLDCYFTRAFYKHILGKLVKYTDIESEDPSFYQSLVYLLENPVSQLGYDLTFSLEVR